MKNLWLPVMSVMVASGTSAALPPNAPAHLRPGANHNTGDGGFVASQGRAPRPGEEKLRMREHFLAVRARLAAAKATRPDLEAKRRKILAHLDAYIAKGTTPDNSKLPWRTPVFIDEHDTICAVGYLIEQTAGRPLADKIASTHRYSYIEDIAKDLPEVRAWVAESGFTLEELGQIQPGYPGPDVLLWAHAKFEDEEGKAVTDGAFEHKGVGGALAKGKLDGAWVAKGKEGQLLGKGTFARGNGAWTSFHANGKKLAEGNFVANAPTGAWRFYHESGNLAAEGNFVAGQRAGAWRFYYDTPKPTPIATGRFRTDGYVDGTWMHYDVKGKLLATTRKDTPEAWTEGYRKSRPLFWNVGYLIDVAPAADRIAHQIHAGTMEGASEARLDTLALDGERIYLRGERVFDTEGYALSPIDVPLMPEMWRADDCKWSATRKKFARRGDVSALNGLISEDATDEACAPAQLITGERARKIGAMVASMAEVRSATPEFMTKVTLDEEHAEDLPEVLAKNMTLDITWPHVDGRFNQVYATLPGYSRWY
ncbi:MAG: hypothetical protein KIT31_37105 [Deltaproteobacteria bacterium]|nr:hypothetical protein [Deltaproteobacteria bacterium]